MEGIREAQEATKVRLRAGLEVDYFPEEESRLERIVGEHDLDFVLGSTHYINGVDIGKRSEAWTFFTGRPVEDAVDEYYTVWKQAVGSGLFDVMAHPDYFRKYVHLFREPITWEEFGEAVYVAIDSLVENDVGIEVNTSGYKHGMGGFFPLEEFLEASYKAGVKKVTVGSDSHEVGTLGFRLGEAVRSLERASFGAISLFEGRRNHSIPIERMQGRAPNR